MPREEQAFGPRPIRPARSQRRGEYLLAGGKHSVVNEWGRVHDVKNLFIVDGSIWVTSGGVNPTSTIQALALYIADSIKKRLATLFD